MLLKPSSNAPADINAYLGFTINHPSMIRTTSNSKKGNPSVSTYNTHQRSGSR